MLESVPFGIQNAIFVLEITPSQVQKAPSEGEKGRFEPEKGPSGIEKAFFTLSNFQKS